MSKLVIVLPCFNEEKVLLETAKHLRGNMKELRDCGLISNDSFILFVDDGSTDATWEIIEGLNKDDHAFKGIKLSCNKGHQNALLAGLLNAYSHSDILITLDADLQDDITVMKEMILKFNDGCDLVYGVRHDRDTDTFFKKWTAQIFNKLLSFLGVNIIYNHSDYRLTSKRVIASLRDYKEVNLFLRGIFPTIGFKSDIVKYDMSQRTVGKSKYTLRKMISLGIDGITSFSSVPLRLTTFAGIFSLVITFFLFLYVLYMNLSGETSKEINFTLVSIYFLGAIQLIGMGLIGEYLGKIYDEVKSRPRFIIDKSHLDT